MRGANVLTGVAVLIWCGLLLVGRDLVGGVVAQKAVGYPSRGQIDFLLVWPAFVVLALLLLAWICNGLRRWAAVLTLLSGLALVAVLPYLFIYGGGV
jgi:hypothetical protein